MNPTTLIVIALVAGALLLIYIIRRASSGGTTRALDVGAVSTRWLAELRRDDPWTRS